MHRRVLILALLLAPACGDNTHVGDDGVTSDGGPIDARPGPDAEDRCVTLCSCTEEFCSDAFDACVAQCATLDDSVRECRIEHCGYAQTNPSFHCPHALGDANSPGIPLACIQP